MQNKEFNKRLRLVNKQYREIFGYIPCITDYVCTREKYMDALEMAIKTKRELKEYLSRYSNPVEEKAET